MRLKTRLHGMPLVKSYTVHVPPPVQMNTSVVHSSGALLLEPLNQLVIEVKVHGVRDALPIRYDTPTDRLKGQRSP